MKWFGNKGIHRPADITDYKGDELKAGQKVQFRFWDGDEIRTDYVSHFSYTATGVDLHVQNCDKEFKLSRKDDFNSLTAINENVLINSINSKSEELEAFKKEYNEKYSLTHYSLDPDGTFSGAYIKEQPSTDNKENK